MNMPINFEIFLSCSVVEEPPLENQRKEYYNHPKLNYQKVIQEV